MPNKKVLQNFYLTLVLSMMFLVSTGCIFTNQNISKVDVEKKVDTVDVVEKVKEEPKKVLEVPKEIPKKEELNLSRPFIFKAENGGYGTAEVTGYLTAEEIAGEEKAIFNLVETNSLEFLNFVGKAKKLDLGCIKNFSGEVLLKLVNSNKDNLIKIQIAKAPASPEAEKDVCYTQFRNLKIIE